MTTMIPIIEARIDSATGLWLEEVTARGPFEMADMKDWCRQIDTCDTHFDIVDAWQRGDEITTVRPDWDEEHEWCSITAAVRGHLV
jgi:hypothetical protein